jgi:hypothetical protein
MPNGFWKQWCAPVSLLLLVACGPSGGTKTTTPGNNVSVRLDPGETTLAIGQSATVAAAVTGASSPTLQWWVDVDPTPAADEYGASQPWDVALAVEITNGSAVVTARAVGTFVLGVEASALASSATARIAVVQAPGTVPFNSTCKRDSECVVDAALCRPYYVYCTYKQLATLVGTSCTKGCSTDADCPSGISCEPTAHYCKLVFPARLCD